MRALISRVWYALRHRRLEDELREEIEAHRAMAQEALERDGVPREDAARAARRALGNDLVAREQARDVWICPWLQDAAQDLRFGARLLFKDFRFTATVVGVLALGLGVNHLFLTLIYSHTLRGLPIDRADRVLWVTTFDDRQTQRLLSYPEFEDVRTGARSFSSIAGFVNAPLVLGDEGRAPDRFDATYLSANAFAVIGVRPLMGRAFLSEDDRPGAAPVLMLGYGAWQWRYGGDPSIVGSSVLVNGQPATVIGIVPSRSGFPSTSEVWLPLHAWPGIASQPRKAPMLRVFGRLRDEVTVAQGRGEIEAIIDRAARNDPEASRNVRARVLPINEQFFGRLAGPWLAFTFAGFLVLFVSAANVANLMLARGVQRSREMAVRRSLGASRSHVIRQLIAEAGVLALLGSSIGFVLAIGGVRLFEQAIPPNLLPYWLHYSIDLRFFIGLVGISLLTLLLFGVAPAVQGSKADVNLVLKDSSRTGFGRRGTGRWTTGFLTAQLALSTVLLAQLVLAVRSDRPDLPSDLTIASTGLLTASLTLQNDRYPTPASRDGFYQRLLGEVRAIPGVSTATLASVLPRRGAVERIVEIAGRPRGPGEPTPSVSTVSIGSDYLETLGLGILRGRSLRHGDGSAGETPAVVNETFVNRFLGGEDPLGQRIGLTAPPNAPSIEPLQLTIVGVAPDIRQRQSQVPDPIVYQPFERALPSEAALLVRTRAPGAVAAADLRNVALAIDASVPLYRMATMAASIDEMDWNGRTSVRLVLLVTWVSIALAAIGLYAVTAYGVSERTQEIGLRMALGARAVQIGRLIFGCALVQTALGFVLGILGSIAWDRAFAVSDRARLRLADPIALAVIGAAVLAITLGACIGPTLRATRLDPLQALRHE